MIRQYAFHCPARLPARASQLPLRQTAVLEFASPQSSILLQASLPVIARLGRVARTSVSNNSTARELRAIPGLHDRRFLAAGTAPPSGFSERRIILREQAWTETRTAHYGRRPCEPKTIRSSRPDRTLQKSLELPSSKTVKASRIGSPRRPQKPPPTRHSDSNATRRALISRLTIARKLPASTRTRVRLAIAAKKHPYQKRPPK